MDTASRARLDELLKKRFFYAPSFSIYGGVAGLYDYGPAGSALQANIISLWRSHFVLEEAMLEVDTTVLTLHDVLKASGHVDRFTDFIVRDVKTGDSFRADHLLESSLEALLSKLEAAAKKQKTPETSDDDKIQEIKEILAQIDGYTEKELQGLLNKYSVKAPETGNDLTPISRFNLMFPADIGPTGQVKGFMRPETAQGIFVNFKRLLESNLEKMPFAAAQIGRSFRNEISPRAGLLRVREFTQAEIEHFVHPQRKQHTRFGEISEVVLPLLPAGTQQNGSGEITHLKAKEAVSDGIVDNETLAYFLARTLMFLIKIGVRLENIRFRQHMANEMSHYASDCWDAEIRSSYGWVECVGCADRSAYDLTQHMRASGERLVVRERLDAPVIQKVRRINLSKKAIGQRYKSDAGILVSHLESLKIEDADTLLSGKIDVANDVEVSVEVGGVEKKFTVTPEMATVEEVIETIHVEEYTPNVVEPSFGIGRIMYSLLENVYWIREGDVQRGVLSLPASVAPIKVLVAPISSGKPDLDAITSLIATSLRRAEISAVIDDASTSIGRRYARHDEIGVPFAVTVDFESPNDGTVTIRERDTCQQVRLPIANVVSDIKSIVSGVSVWDNLIVRYGLVNSSDK